MLPYVGVFDVKPPGYFALLAIAEVFLGPNSPNPSRSHRSMRRLHCDGTFPHRSSTRLASGRHLRGGALSLFVGRSDWQRRVFSLDRRHNARVRRCILLDDRRKEVGPCGPRYRTSVTIKQTAVFEAVILFGISLRAPNALSAPAALAFTLAAAVAPICFLSYFAAHGAATNLITDAFFGALDRGSRAGEHFSLVNCVIILFYGVVRFLPMQTPVLPITEFATLALLRSARTSDRRTN